MTICLNETTKGMKGRELFDACQFYNFSKKTYRTYKHEESFLGFRSSTG